MAEFGDELRLERESRGISLDWLSAETKVNRRYLEALELGHLDQLPGGVFRRGIFRSYTSSLGLIEAEWSARFDASVSKDARTRGQTTSSDEEAWFVFASNVKRNRAKQRRSSSRRWLGVGALLILLAATVYALWFFQLRRFNGP